MCNGYCIIINIRLKWIDGSTFATFENRDVEKKIISGRKRNVGCSTFR